MGVHYISGDDESLVLSALGDLVRQLVGDNDRSLMVDDFDDAEFELAAVVDAAQTPPFLSDRRVVIARSIGRFNAEQVAPLVQYLADSLPSTDLVLVAGGGRVPKSVTDALKKAGAVTIATAPPSRSDDRVAWFAEHARSAGIRLDGSAVSLLSSWLGEDAGRLQGIVDTLVSTYGTDSSLKAADIEPFLGEAGGVPPWDLTDAVDRGDTTAALQLLHRPRRVLPRQRSEPPDAIRPCGLGLRHGVVGFACSAHTGVLVAPVHIGAGQRHNGDVDAGLVAHVGLKEAHGLAHHVGAFQQVRQRDLAAAEAVATMLTIEGSNVALA